VDFRRIENLPPYVFSIINGLKIEARQAGADVVDLGFGNPDIPSPDIAVAKLAEAAQNPRNHRYSLSRGLPKLREAIADYYKNKWDVDLDPELEITNTIGSKEGFTHLMWVLLDRGDAAIVPSPSYPIHMYGPLFAGADLRQVPMKFLANPSQRENFADDFMDSLQTAWDVGWPKPRVLVMSFPHNPTGATVTLSFMQRVVDFCREKEMIVVHDNAYADMGFDGHEPPSILKSYLDYGMFQPVQIAATVTINEAPEFPDQVREVYESRCDTLIDGLQRIGWDVPKPGGTMFVWAPIPEAYSDMGSVEFCSHVVREADVALSPGVGFGPGGEGFARFALIENELRINQAIRNLKRGLPKLG
jgi:alanine-synthesizing transaminase